MRISKAEVTLLRCDLREGVGKTSGKPYKFYQLDLVDDDARVFKLNVSDELVKTFGEVGMKKLLELRNESMKVDIEIYPKGFDIGANVVAID